MQAGKHIRRDFFHYTIIFPPDNAHWVAAYHYSIRNAGMIAVSYEIERYLDADFFDGMPCNDIMRLIKDNLTTST